MWIEINMTINRSQRVMIRKRRARINHRSREAWVQGPAEIDYGIEQSASTLAGLEGPVLVLMNLTSADVSEIHDYQT